MVPNIVLSVLFVFMIINTLNFSLFVDQTKMDEV